MKRFLQFSNTVRKEVASALAVLFVVMFSSASVFSQDVVVNRTVVPNEYNCSQFDVTLSITGTPSPVPSEVVLIIDRSGSMDDGDSPDPIDFAKDAAIDFVNELFDNNPTGLNRVGVVSYSSSATIDIGLTGSSGRQNVINAINNIVTGGSTNIQDGIVKADQVMTNQGTFNCVTSRNIILLTDGVTNRDNNSNSCSNNQMNSICQQNAIQAGINAQLTTKNGEDYAQNIYSVGLFEQISGEQQTIAENTINQIQNAGLYVTENEADLSNIYLEILGQLAPAARPIMGLPLVEVTKDMGFDFVPGSVATDKGKASISGDMLSWFVNQVSGETIQLTYSIVKASQNVCGANQNTGPAIMRYQDADCNDQQLTFNSPKICVPCPEITAEIESPSCNVIEYDAHIYQGDCTPVSSDVAWEFFLNDVSVGTSDQLSGTYTYTGGEDFTGNFRAEVSFNGTYGSGCVLPGVDDDTTLKLPGVIKATLTKEDATFAGGCNDGEATVKANGGSGAYTYLWSASAGSQTTATATNLPEGTHTVTISDEYGCEVTEEVQILCDIDGWNFACGEDKLVDEYGSNANCNQTTTVNLPNPSSIFQYVVEIVYKGGNPGSVIQVTDDASNSYDLQRTTPTGSSSNIWVYRKLINGSTGTLTYTNSSEKCKLQSIVVYAFRNVPNASSNSGKFTTLSGVNNIVTFTIDIPSFSGPRDLVVETPISELTNDGRYLLLKAQAGSVTEQQFIYGSDSSLPGGTCCLAVPKLRLENVPGNVTQVTITIDTRNRQNGQSVNGQSWVIGGGVNVDADCFSDADISLIKTGVFDDNNGNNNAEVGETITYQFTVTNTGDITLYDITVDDPLVTVNGSLASLAPGASNSTAFTATYTITQDDINNEEVINQAFAEGCYESLPVDPDGNCSGQVDYLELEYLGSVADALIKVVEHDGQTVFEGVVQPGERFEFFGQDPPQQTLGPKINISINGTFVQEIHTSCSEPIGPGAVYGDFEVIKGTSRNNGPLQPIAGPDPGCVASATDLSDDNSNLEDDPTVVPLPIAPPVELALESKTDILCNGDATGVITVTATGGLPPNEYSINGGAPQASPTFENLTAGVYTITVTDAVGSTDSISVTLEEPEPLSIQITKVNASATGACANGQATANPSGGVAPYSYQWSASANNQTTMKAVNLPIGTHTVVVTDANGCTLEQGVVIDCIDNCDAVISVDDVNNVLCAGDLTGSATVSASSIANPGSTFTFTWNTVPPQVNSGATSSTITNLAAGVYTVSVTIDGTLCLPVEQSVTITEPANALNVTATSTDETGPTTGDGTATANPSGGTLPYTYSWSPGGEDTQTITGLSAGTYSVTVTDANGCTASATTTVNPGTCRDLAATASSTSVSCNGGDDGTATVGVTGGLGPFTFTWSNGATTQSIADLSAGTYTVTVTDGSTQCTTTATTTVNEPGALSSGIAVTNVKCFGDATGSLDLTVTGGTAPYTFKWNNGEVTEDLFNLTAGTYSVLIIDANGCKLQDSATVHEPAAELTLEISSQTDIVCEAEGSLTVTAAGGTAPYLYSLNGGASQASGTFGNLEAGVYEITVTDSNGCTAEISATLLENCTLAINDINDTFVNTPVAGNVLTNDIDFENDTQTVTTTSVVTAQGVTVTIDANSGAYIYNPPTDFAGEDTFEYTICDNGNPQACDTAVVYIEVLPQDGPNNDPPVANADTNSTLLNVPVEGNVLPNDFDPDGDPITVTANTDPSNGTVVVNPDGSYIYTPNTDFVGEDTFEYTICDNGSPALCDTAIVTIQVLDREENITTAVDDAYYTTVDVSINGNVLDNDTDPQNNDQFVDVAISPSNGPTNGTVTLNANGTFSYSPNPGFTGTDSFVYEIFDNGSPVATDVATVTILVGNIGNDILAVDDINDTFVNLPVSGSVATNDQNPDGPAGTEVFTLVSGPANGTLSFNADGSYTYTPATDFIGDDTFVYQVCDGGSPVACDTATVYIRVQPLGSPANEAPVANADTNATQVNVPVGGNVLPNDFDPDGDPITVTANTDPSNGTVVVNADGSYTYTPNTDFVGEDTFEYTICDNGSPALCDTAIVTIQVVDGTGNITTAVDDAYFGFPDTDITGNVLDNDTDPEGDAQTVDVAVSPSNGPSNGTVVLNANGTFTYTPNAGFSGTDSFVYTIFDNGSPVARDSATVYISIDPNGGGNDILAVDDINNTYIDLPVSGNVATNDENFDGPIGTEVFTLVNSPVNGTLIFNADGTYTYTPANGFIGEDTFEYQICDAGNPVACDTAMVYIEVLPLGGPDNQAPIANTDVNITEVDVPVNGNVLINDFDPDGDPITVTANTDPSNGTVVVNPDGSYTYTPNPGFEGEDTFEYTICDNGSPALCDTALVIIQVVPNAGNSTVANDDAYNGFIDQPISGNILDNDFDPEGDSQLVDIAVSPVSGPTNGTLNLNANGSFTYTPNGGFFGTDQFVYEIFDNGSPVARDRASVYITIADPGNDILAVDDINDTFVNLPVSGSVATNDQNPDGPAGTEVFTLVSGPANGTLSFNADGSYTYTPATDFIGDDTFVYQVCDGGNPIACDTATVYIRVQPLGSPANEAPVANADTNATQVNVPVGGNVLPNDFDPDGDPITVTANTDPSNGTVVVNADGSYTYTPNTDFVGEDTFEYTICDNGSPALCDTAIVTIQVVDGTGNITTAVDDAYFGFPDTDITGNVLDNDTDPEGDAQTVDVAVSPSSGPSNGTVVLNANGTFTYTPNAGFSGTDSFVYTIFDNGSPVARDSATVYISIDPNGGGNDILAVDDINDTFVNLPVSGDVGTNDENADGPAGTEVFTLVSGPVNGGTLVFNADGTYTYTPVTDYVGEDSFQYQVCDGGNPIACDTATVTIEIVDDPILENDPPIANNDTNTTEVDVPVSGTVLANDFDPDNDPITVTANTDPSNGMVVVNPDGTYTYTPNPGFEGEDTFEYTICDNGNPALCDTATVIIYVIPNTGNITVANDDAYYGEINTTVTGNVLDNDSDPEGNSQFVDTTISPVSGPSNGTVVINADGTFTYTPGTDFTGNDQFVYAIFDDGSPVATDQATVYILIEETPAPAIAIVKTGQLNDQNGNGCSDVGETITYTFSVTNQGNVPLNTITVTDPLLETPNPVVPIVLVSGDDGDGILQESETWIFTADYSITQTDIDTGEVMNQATAEGTDPDGTVVTDLSGATVTTDEVTTTTLCQNASIALIKTGVFNDEDQDGCSDVDETISYTFTVINTGNVTLTDITVTDPLVSVSGGPLATLAVGSSDDTTFSATYSITQADIDNGSVSNQATVTGTSPSGTMSDLSDDDSELEDEPTVTDLCQNASIALIKTGVFNDEDQDGCSDVDETISYTFTVINTGNVTLTDITVTDPLVSVSGGPLATLAVGSSDDTTFSATYSITQADIDNGSVSNQASVTGTSPSGTVSDLSDDDSELEDDPTVTDLCQNASIAIIKEGEFQGQGDCSQVGDAIAYTFTVTNEGNVTLANPTVTDPLLGGIIAGPASGDDNGDGNLDVVETWIYEAQYIISQDDIDTGVVINQAEAKAVDTAGNAVTDLSDDNSVLEDDPTVTEICRNPAIAVIKTGIFNDEDQDGCADIDETISYTFTVTNEGNVNLFNIDLNDPLLGGPISGPISGDDDGDAELDISEVWTYEAPYTITQADIDAGNVTNQATVQATAPDQSTVSDLSDDNSVLEDDPTVTELCQNASIALIKTGTVNDTNGDGCADVDETISYTFTVVNTGNATLTNVVVTDPLVAVQGGPIATLAAGATDATTFTALYTLTQADIDAGIVINQATVEATAPDQSIVSDLSDDDSVLEDDPTETVLCQNANIALLKTGVFNDENDNGCSDVGETITYSFTVVNVGNVALTTITVQDPLVAVQGGPISLDVGETDSTSFTATYTITQEDINAGVVINQALAEGLAPDGTSVSDFSDNDSLTEDDPTETDLCQLGSLSLEKTGVFNDDNGDGIPQEGETITYLFTVYNTGNVTLYNITIEDPLPGIIIEGGPIAELAPGESDNTTFVGTYAITDADIEEEQVINQATATGTDPQGNTVSDDSDDPNILDNVDNNGDGEPDDPTITIIPNVGGVEQPPFEIFNGVTPNGDNMNDYFIIKGIAEYPNNNVKIFNRWGVLVWETDGYEDNANGNVFRGRSNGRATVREGEDLPTGTYFYILSFPAENPGESSYTGYLYLNR